MSDTATADEHKPVSVRSYLDKEIERRLNEQMRSFEQHVSKDFVVPGAHKHIPKQVTGEDQELVNKYYHSLAFNISAEQAEVNDIVAKQYMDKYNMKEQDIQTIGSGTDGGVLVPTTVADSIVSQMFYISPIRQLATVIDNMPAQLQLPSEESIVEAYWVSEGSTGTDSGDVFAPNMLTPQKIMGMDSFTSEILADAATNPSIQNYIEQRFAIALALLENNGFTMGSGAGMPYGFRSSAITPNSVAQAGDGLVYDDILTLWNSLATAYRQVGVFVTSTAGMRALLDVKDNYGRPIWIHGLQEGQPDVLLNRPIYIVDEIPDDLGEDTNATELWFGNFKNYFIGDRGGLRVDYGTNGTDFANDKISLRVAKRVAGRPTIGQGFSVLTGVIAS